MKRGLATAVAAALCALAAAAEPARGAQRHEALTLSPSRAVGTASPGLTAGPFRLTNSTRSTLAVTASPVLLSQDRAGAIGVRADAASRRRARRLLSVQGRASAVGPGGHVGFLARLLRPSPAGGFYGGVLVRSEPVGRTRETLLQIFQLNASLLLRPPADERRLRLRAGALRAAQDGRELLLTTAVTNAGNVHARLRGELRVRREGGDRVLLRRRLQLPVLLPGATVDLPARTGTVELPAGRYEAVADLRSGDERLRAFGRFRLYGTNAPATRDGRLVVAAADDPTLGEPVELRATWHNRGNLPFAPRVVAEVRRLGARGAGRPLRATPLEADEAAPGREGAIEGRLPALRDGNYEVTVRLLDGPRELDRRSFSVSPEPAVGPWQEAREWLAAHPLLLPGVLLAALLATLAHFVRRHRRLQARLAQAEGRMDGGR